MLQSLVLSLIAIVTLASVPSQSVLSREDMKALYSENIRTKAAVKELEQTLRDTNRQIERIQKALVNLDYVEKENAATLDANRGNH